MTEDDLISHVSWA